MLAVSVLVWSHIDSRYQPFTDLAGFANHDQVRLDLGLSLFIYDAAVVDGVRAQDHAHTAAEKALRGEPAGVGDVNPPFTVAAVQADQAESIAEESSVLRMETELEQEAGHLIRKTIGRSEESQRISEVDHLGEALLDLSKDREEPFIGDGDAVGAFDFEARKPWYLYDTASEGEVGKDSGAVIVPAVTKELVQVTSRVITADVAREALPAEWGEVALRLRIEKPDGLEMDHWDRKGSIGLLVSPMPGEQTNGVALFSVGPGGVVKQE